MYPFISLWINCPALLSLCNIFASMNFLISLFNNCSQLLITVPFLRTTWIITVKRHRMDIPHHCHPRALIQNLITAWKSIVFINRRGWWKTLIAKLEASLTQNFIIIININRSWYESKVLTFLDQSFSRWKGFQPLKIKELYIQCLCLIVFYSFRNLDTTKLVS